MIVVCVLLKSAITGKVTEIARAHICNVGGTDTVGDYHVQTLRGRSSRTLDKSSVTRSGIVTGHRRRYLHVWHLVAKALKAMKYGE